MFNDLIMELPQEAAYILRVLNEGGFEAYIVGGCVRDSIQKKIPKDWDISTNAKPHEVKSLFGRTIDTGIKHGTVTVLIDNRSFEVTTYRIDGDYADSRRPLSVRYTSLLMDDLSRRDFTMNAIAFHPNAGLVDPFNGIGDIEQRVIRTVGSPERRFREDALRMIRAVRFSAQLDFAITKDAIQSIRNNSALIRNISHERIRDELTKILESENPSKFILLRDTNLLQYILPEFEICFHTPQNNAYHIYNTAVHTLNSIAHVACDGILRWTMLLHDIGKPLAKTTDIEGIDHFFGHPEKSVQLSEIILKRLKFDNKTIKKICRLIRYHDMNIKPDPVSVRKAVITVGDDIFADLVEIQKADKKAQNPKFLEERLACLSEIEKNYFDVKEKKQCLSLKDLAVDGHDLMDIGLVEGKKIKTMLIRLLNIVVENPELNNKDELLKSAGRIKQASDKV